MEITGTTANPVGGAAKRKYNTEVMEQLKTTDPDAYKAIMNQISKGWTKFEAVEKNLEKQGFDVTLSGKSGWTYDSMTIKDKAGNTFKLFDGNGDGAFSSKDFNFNSSLSSAVSSIKSSAKTTETSATEATKTDAVSNVDKTDAISNIEKEDSTDPLNSTTKSVNTTALQLQLQSYLYDLGYKSSEIEDISSRMIDSGAISEAQTSGASGADLFTIFNKYIPISTLA